MSDYLKKIQDEKIAIGERLKAVRKANNISLESIERVYPLEWSEAIENGSFITDKGVIIGIEKILGYCDLIEAGFGPFNRAV